MRGMQMFSGLARIERSKTYTFSSTCEKPDKRRRINIGISPTLRWRFSGIFPGFLLFGACFCGFLLVVAA